MSHSTLSNFVEAKGLRNTTWTGLVPVDDTALAVTDTDGPGRPVVYLNGAYAFQSFSSISAALRPTITSTIAAGLYSALFYAIVTVVITICCRART